MMHLKLTQTLSMALPVWSMSFPNLNLPSTLCLHSKHPLASHAWNPKQIPICLCSVNLPGRLTPSTQANSLSNIFDLIFNWRFWGFCIPFDFLFKLAIYMCTCCHTLYFIFFNFAYLFSILWVGGACLYVSVQCVRAWCPHRPEKDIVASEIGGTESCEPPCRCWQLSRALWKTHKYSKTVIRLFNPWTIFF